MSKLFVAVLAFSTVSLAVGDQGSGPYHGISLDTFAKHPKIKQLAVAVGAYPGDDTNGEDLYKAIAVLQTVSVLGVKQVVKEHAPKLFQRIKAAEEAFVKVRNSVDNKEVKHVLDEFGIFVEKYYLVGVLINEQLYEQARINKLIFALKDEEKDQFGAKLKEAAEAVEKALYKP